MRRRSCRRRMPGGSRRRQGAREDLDSRAVVGQVLGLVVLVLTDGGLPDHLAGVLADRHDVAGLARADGQRSVGAVDARGRQDGCCLEVEVEQVVRAVLVVPADRARPGVDGHHRGRVQVVARPAGAVRAVRSQGPWGRVADTEVDVAVVVDGGRVPEPTAAGHGDRVEPTIGGVEPPLGLAGAGIERVEDTSVATGIERTQPRAGGGADVDGAVIDDGRHVDALAGRAADLLAPHDAAVAGLECHDLAGVAQTGIDHVVRDRHAVGADAADIERGLPLLGAGVAVEREHVAAHVLDVDGVAHDDGLGGDASEEAGRRDVERPGELEVADGVLGDARIDRVAGRRQVALGYRPVARQLLGLRRHRWQGRGRRGRCVLCHRDAGDSERQAEHERSRTRSMESCNQTWTGSLPADRAGNAVGRWLVPMDGSIGPLARDGSEVRWPSMADAPPSRFEFSLPALRPHDGRAQGSG